MIHNLDLGSHRGARGSTDLNSESHNQSKESKDSLSVPPHQKSEFDFVILIILNTRKIWALRYPRGLWYVEESGSGKNVPVWISQQDAQDYLGDTKLNLEIFEINFDSLMETWLVVFEKLDQTVKAYPNAKQSILLKPKHLSEHLKSLATNSSNKPKDK